MLISSAGTVVPHDFKLIHIHWSLRIQLIKESGVHMSVWAKYLEVDFFGAELLAGKSTKIEWLKPVFAEDVLTGKAVITNLVKRSPKNGLVEISIEAYNQHGELVLKDVTEAIVKCRPAEQ